MKWWKFTRSIFFLIFKSYISNLSIVILGSILFGDDEQPNIFFVTSLHNSVAKRAKTIDTRYCYLTWFSFDVFSDAELNNKIWRVNKHSERNVQQPLLNSCPLQIIAIRLCSHWNPINRVIYHGGNDDTYNVSNTYTYIYVHAYIHRYEVLLTVLTY